MKKLTKRSILAVLALVLAVVTLGTTSYAWFTLGNTVNVDEFELNVQGGEGLEFAFLPSGEGIDGDLDWVSFISSDDLMAYLVTEYGITATAEESSKQAFARGFELDAVTSKDGVSFFAFNTNEDGTPSLSTEPVSDNKAAGVLEFKLAFRTIAKPTTEAPVNLIWSQATLTGTPNPWSPEKPFTSSKGVPVTVEEEYNVSDAARISVAGKEQNQSDDVVVVYEKAEDDTNTVLSNSWEANWNELGAHSYYKEVTGHDLSPTFNAWVNTTIETVQSISDNKVSSFGLDAVSMGGTDYYTTSVTVRVYIEGFDLEAFNSILSQALQVALRFKLEVTTTP